MERLDKVLANLGYGSRKEIKVLAKKGVIVVDGVIQKDSAVQVNPESSSIEVNGEKIFYRKNIYLMLNKPDGVISATEDNYDKTVIDLIDAKYAAFNPFPVGRLDKDTVGLLILTNDGELNHRLIAPKWHVDKVYYAKIDASVDEEDQKAFEKGITLDDGYKCMPGNLEILSVSDNLSEVKVTIHEGKFHQVKRMFESLGKHVIYLKRETFGPIKLDTNLEEGEYRELTEEEVNQLRVAVKLV